MRKQTSQGPRVSEVVADAGNARRQLATRNVELLSDAAIVDYPGARRCGTAAIADAM